MGSQKSLIKKAFEVNARVERFSKGAYVYFVDQVAFHIFIVIEGRVKMTRALDNTNREFIHYFIYPNEAFGIGEYMTKLKTRRLSAIAIDHTVTLWKIPYFRLKMELKKNPKLVDYLLVQLMKREESIWKRYHRSPQLLVKETVIAALEDFALERGVETENGIAIQGFTHSDLAGYVGVSRQNVTQALNKLRKENKVEYNRKEILLKARHEESLMV